MKNQMFEIVSVNDELPEEEKYVNVFQNDDTLSHRAAIFSDGVWYDESDFELYNVTFWLKEIHN